MARRVTPSQVRSKLRQIQQKRQQAINKYNQSVRRYNDGVKKAVNNYNQAVRTHNSRVRSNRQRIQSELNRLSAKSSTRTTTHVIYRTSVEILHQSYGVLEQKAQTSLLGDQYTRLLDLSERETANSLEVTNEILGSDAEPEEYEQRATNENVHSILRGIGPDLEERWGGAVYSLNPHNPDAARHFCTSAREILVRILETKAPDADVFSILPNCDVTDRGTPTRRSKISYLLHRRGMHESSLEDFVENDMENIVQLFAVFNDGTHGSAGKFNLRQLGAIKNRVEDGIIFLNEIVHD